MSRSVVPTRLRPWLRSPVVARAVSAGLAVLTGMAALWSVPAAHAAPGIYTCVDASGRRLTSDRPIPECLDREQRVLGKDGSPRKVIGPRLTPQERAAQEELKRRREAAEVARKDAVRRDRNLLGRFPDEPAHQRARQAALDDVHKSIASSNKRIADLQAERKPLLADAEFYKGKPMPYKLRSALEANQTSQEAQQQLIENQQAELVRVNGLFDAELARLRKLWAGAEPGTVPMEPATPTAGGRAAGGG